MSLKQGFNIVGILSGSVQNQNNNSYYTIGVVENSQDEFGANISTPHRIGVNQTNHERLKPVIDQLKGKLISINVICRAVDGRNGAFLSLDGNQNTIINLIDSNEK